MKNHMKKLFTLIAITLFVYNVFAQAPQRLSYQAVIRNSTGGLVTNHAVGMKISILQGSSSGTAVYVETHTTTTNSNGLATIEIGGGSLVSGSFATINWSGSTYYLKTETDPAGGTSYSITGTSQLLSVPYALHAREVQIGSSKWEKSGSDIYYNRGRVGMGVTSPFAGLHVKGTGFPESFLYLQSDAAADAGLRIIEGDQTKWHIFNSSSAGGLQIWNSAIKSAIFCRQSDAFIGLGTTSPESGLHLKGTGLPSAFMIAESDAGQDAGIRFDEGTTAKWSVFNDASAGGLQIYNTGAQTAIFCKQANAYVGIRTTTPQAGLHLKGTGYPSAFFYIQSDAGQDAGMRFYEGTTAKWHIFNNSAAGGLHIYNNNVTTAIFAKQSTCFVGLGTTNPLFRLDVIGSIRATGSVYYGGSEGTGATAYSKPDYVFGESYNVMEIDEVEEFLQRENHLPWITSAEKEKQENGNVTNMTRMAFETVETIENLQLQIIEQRKLIRELEARLKKLEAKGRR